MKTIFALCALLTTAVAVRVDFQSRWNDFKLTHMKQYESPEEEKRRLEIFQDNLRLIKEQNARYEAGVDTHLLGITPFADLTDEEFVDVISCRTPNVLTDSSVPVFKPSGITAPASYDWRNHSPRVVEPVRNQGTCRSCWAHAAAEIVESNYSFKQNRTSKPLSPQHLVNCVFSHCSSGITSRALDYIKQNGVAVESACPYTGVDGQCKQYNGSVYIKSYSAVRTENNMKEALVKKGPIGVAVDGKEWKLYVGGIYKAKQPFVKLTHDLVADGYGTEKGEDYWLLRNSWSTFWGENGYIRIRRNTNEFGIIKDVVAIDA